MVFLMFCSLWGDPSAHAIGVSRLVKLSWLSHESPEILGVEKLRLGGCQRPPNWLFEPKARVIDLATIDFFILRGDI